MVAAGVCHSDLHVRDGEWEREGPIVMGHEGSAIVEALGRGRRGGVPRAPARRPRRAVVADPVRRLPGLSRRPGLVLLGQPVVHPPDAERPGGAPATRSGRDVLTYCAIGTFAERQNVPAAAAIPMPDGVAAGRRGPDRLLRDDGRRGRGQDRRGPARVVASPSSGSAGSGCRA